jgi:hypothetical protein
MTVDMDLRSIGLLLFPFKKITFDLIAIIYISMNDVYTTRCCPTPSSEGNRIPDVIRISYIRKTNWTYVIYKIFKDYNGINDKLNKLGKLFFCTVELDVDW